MRIIDQITLALLVQEFQTSKGVTYHIALPVILILARSIPLFLLAAVCNANHSAFSISGSRRIIGTVKLDGRVVAIKKCSGVFNRCKLRKGELTRKAYAIMVGIAGSDGREHLPVFLSLIRRISSRFSTLKLFWNSLKICIFEAMAMMAKSYA
jgi:hypothetical protein